MLWARVMRGISSTERVLTPRRASPSTASRLVSGLQKPTSTAPCPGPSGSVASAAASTAATIPQRSTSARSATRAPFAV